MSNIVPYDQVERMAQAVAKSNLFGVKSADQALALMLVAQAEGRHPALAARDYDIIQGRPSKKSEAMLRDFLESGGKVEWHDLTDTVADATFSHPSGGSVRISWDMKRAQAAGLGGKDMWKKYPRQMLRARAVSEGIRTVCPMATSGFYVPEEVADFTPEKNITPTSGAKDRVEPSKANEIDELAKKVQEFADAGQYEDAVLTVENEALDADQMTYLWTQFDAPTRKQLKAASKALKEKYAAQVVETPKEKTITEAQRKRLEARISELKLNRDDIKLKCKEDYGREHFSELTQSEYEVISKYVDDSDDFIKGLDSDPKNVL